MEHEVSLPDFNDIEFLCFKACCESMTELIRIVEGAFDMDILGMRENARSAGLSKNYKKPEHLWTPGELEIDNKMKVVSSQKKVMIPTTTRSEFRGKMESRT